MHNMYVCEGVGGSGSFVTEPTTSQSLMYVAGNGHLWQAEPLARVTARGPNRIVGCPGFVNTSIPDFLNLVSLASCVSK